MNGVSSDGVIEENREELGSVDHFVEAVSGFLGLLVVFRDFEDETAGNSGAHGGQALRQSVGDGVDKLLETALVVDLGEELVVVESHHL